MEMMSWMSDVHVVMLKDDLFLKILNFEVHLQDGGRDDVQHQEQGDHPVDGDEYLQDL